MRMRGSIVLAVGAALVACVTAPEDARVTPKQPDRQTFPPVADLLARRCGSLDCHGMRARNLRIFSATGLRLAATDRPTSHPNSTTTAEYDEDFFSVVGLEPEILGDVVSEGGARPERLTLVRKARNTEHHKGEKLLNEGDDADRCITSWLAGKTDTATCTKATATFPFP